MATVKELRELEPKELRARAAERDARLLQVPRLDRTLVPSDLMARMPHSEHPANLVGRASSLRRQ